MKSSKKQNGTKAKQQIEETKTTEERWYNIDDSDVKMWYIPMTKSKNKEDRRKAQLIYETYVKTKPVEREDGIIKIDYVEFGNIEDAIFFADPLGKMNKPRPKGTKTEGPMMDFGFVTGMQSENTGGSYYRFDYDPND